MSVQARRSGRPTWVTSGTEGDENPGHEGSRPMFIPTVVHRLCSQTALGATTSPSVIWETPQPCNTEGHNEAGGVTVVTRPQSHGQFGDPLTALGHKPRADAAHVGSMYL